MKINTEEKMRHSAAHVLAQAVLEMFPDAKLGIGPATEDGFYYDFQIEADIESDKTVLVELEERMNKIIEAELPFTQIFLSKDEAIDMLHQQGQIFKTELLQTVSEEEVSFYKTGEDFTDLCRGPHVDDTGKIGAVKLTGVEQVHWLANENRPLMYRISGVAFNNKQELEAYLGFQASLKTRDHLKISQRQNLIIASHDNREYTLLEQGIGLQNMIYQTSERSLQTNRAAQIQINQFKLIKDFTQLPYEPYYQDRECIKLSDDLLFVASNLNEAASFLIKELHNRKDYSLARCYSYLKYLNLEQIKNSDNQGLYQTVEATKLQLAQLGETANWLKDLRELLKIIVSYYRKLLENDFYFKLAVAGDTASDELVALLSEFNLNIKKTKLSQAGFEISLFHKDIFKNSWELATIRSLPELAKALTKQTANNNQEFVYLQVDLISSIERLMALLIEHYNGEFPLTLAPFQAIVISEADDYNDYARMIYKQLLDQGLRMQLNTEHKPMAQKVEQATEQKYPYILTIGEQEAKNNVFSVKPNSEEDLGLMTVAEFLQKLGDIS